jgi:glycerol-3-phosphate acyltransferase PlsX
MNIALDVMGGDHAPHEIVAGAVSAARTYDVTVSLVGKPDVIAAELKKHAIADLRLPIVPASEVIEMDDKPASAVRGKPDNSMAVACRLVRSGAAQAFVTAGNTGGALAAGIFHVGRMKGVLRPALISPFPTHHGFCLLLDIGANADVRPEYLQQFAIMGSLYAQEVFGIANPSVRILSNGEEDGKGNQLVLDAAKLLAATPGIRFLGNVESKEIVEGAVDVVVTDGFTGNVFIKTAEAAVRLMQSAMREEYTRNLRSKVGALISRPALDRLRSRLDDSQYGGAVLLGLAGLVIVTHGRSKAPAIMHAVRVAKQAIEHDILNKIHSAIEKNLHTHLS